MAAVTKIATESQRCIFSNEHGVQLMEQITALKSEVISLQKDVMDLRERIGAVRGWIKNALIIFSIFCILVISGHYVFLLQLPEVERAIKELNSNIVKLK